jgi:hypothetical protein
MLKEIHDILHVNISKVTFALKFARICKNVQKIGKDLQSFPYFLVSAAVQTLGGCSNIAGHSNTRRQFKRYTRAK